MSLKRGAHREYKFLLIWSLYHLYEGDSLGVQIRRNLPTMRETWVRSLGQEDALEKGMATPSLPGESHGQRSLVGSQGMTKGLTLSCCCCCCLDTSVMSNSVWPYRLQPARLLCPWDSLGKSIEMGCHALLWGTFPAQGSNPGLLHCRQILYHWAAREVQHFYIYIQSFVWKYAASFC